VMSGRRLRQNSNMELYTVTATRDMMSVLFCSRGRFSNPGSHGAYPCAYRWLHRLTRVALQIWHTSSVRCVTHLARLVNALRYTFGTPH
jgi:hypothetical protein